MVESIREPALRKAETAYGTPTGVGDASGAPRSPPLGVDHQPQKSDGEQEKRGGFGHYEEPPREREVCDVDTLRSGPAAGVKTSQIGITVKCR